MRRILVFRGGALGDFIVTLPALGLLRTRWPASRIEWVGNASAARLAMLEGLVDAVHSQDEGRWAALFGPGPLPSALADWLRPFDLIVSYWPDPDGELARHFPLRADQAFLSAPAKPSLAPAALHYCEPLKAVGLAPPDPFFPLARFGHVRPPAAPPSLSSVRRVAIHPGSGSPAKNWPLARWEELCRRLREESSPQLLIVSGEAEPPDALLNFGSPLRGLAVAELAERLASCGLFLGHDSGVSHLAAACGVPCLLLFGPTDPRVWAPPAPHVRVVRKGPEMTSLSVDDVFAALGGRAPAGFPVVSPSGAEA